MILLNINSGAQLMYQFSDISLIEDILSHVLILSALSHVLILSALSHVLDFFFFLKSTMQKKDEFKYIRLYIGYKM